MLGKSMHLQGVDWSLFAYYRGVHKIFVKGPLPLQKNLPYIHLTKLTYSHIFFLL